MQHELHDRGDGLAHCKVCGGAEASLPTDCPGRMMHETEQEQIAHDRLDYRGGEWVALYAVDVGAQYPHKADTPQFIDRITVRLVQHVGSDAMLVHAARVSLLGMLTGEEPPPEEMRRLLRYLMQHRHGTPFEHGSMTFRVHAPIFVFREWHRHRVGWSYNEESARYRPLAPVFWLPPEARPLIPAPGSKAARPTFVAGTPQHQQHVRDSLSRAYEYAYNEYRHLLDSGIAREVARACLPVGIYSSMYATCNPRSLLHFLSLRTHEPQAAFVSYPQAEIENAARQMEALAAEVWPVTLGLFNELGRVAP